MGHDVLIYTPTILAGVSFTEKWYDACICFWYDTTCTVGSCLQMMRCVCNIASGIYIHSVCASGNTLSDTVTIVKEFIEAKYDNIRTKYIPVAGEIQLDGRITYAAGVNYDAFCGYLANVNASRNSFLELLVNELKLMGCKLEAFVVVFF